MVSSLSPLPRGGLWRALRHISSLSFNLLLLHSLQNFLMVTCLKGKAWTTLNPQTFTLDPLPRCWSSSPPPPLREPTIWPRRFGPGRARWSLRCSKRWVTSPGWIGDRTRWVVVVAVFSSAPITPPTLLRLRPRRKRRSQIQMGLNRSLRRRLCPLTLDPKIVWRLVLSIALKFVVALLCIVSISIVKGKSYSCWNDYEVVNFVGLWLWVHVAYEMIFFFIFVLLVETLTLDPKLRNG